MNFTSKLGFYDFLNVFIIGVLWVTCFCSVGLFEAEFVPIHKCCKKLTNELYDFINPILFCAICFVIGLIMHHLSQYLFLCICKIFKHKRHLKISTKLLRSLCRNDERLIEIAREENLPMEKICLHSDDCSLRRYYFAYYYLQASGNMGNIPFLEAQEAFTKDLLPLIVAFWISAIAGCKTVLICFICNFQVCENCIIWILPLLFVLIFVVHSIIQNKIYSLVCEGSHFLSRIEHLRTGNTQIVDMCLCREFCEKW